MTIAGFATGCERGYLYLRGEYPLAAAADAPARSTAARAAGLLGRDVMAPGLRLRHRDPARRRRLHLRRGDGALQLDRGQARRAAQQAAVPGRRSGCSASRRWSTTSRRSSTCSSSLREGGAAYGGIGTSGSTGTKLFCVSGAVARPGLYEVPFGITLRRRCSSWRAASPAAGRCRRCCWAARRASSSAPDQLDVPADLRGHPGRRRDARLRRGHGLRRDAPTCATSSSASPSSSATNRAASACPAAWAPCGRRSCSRGCARPAAAGAAELALLRELGRSMRDASICGLGQTASSAIESALAAPRPSSEARA